MLNLIKPSGVYGCWVQYVCRSYCKLLVKSRSGFERCKEIRLRLKRKRGEENVKLHRKGTNVLREASINLANGVILVIRNGLWQHYQNPFLLAPHRPPGQHLEMK